MPYKDSEAQKRYRRIWMQNWRKNHPEEYRDIQKRSRSKDQARKLRAKRTTEYQRRNREKQRAHQAVFRAVHTGKLTKSCCQRCKSEIQVEGHHSDYFKKLDVTWLCNQCHREIHGAVA